MTGSGGAEGRASSLAIWVSSGAVPAWAGEPTLGVPEAAGEASRGSIRLQPDCTPPTASPLRRRGPVRAAGCPVPGATVGVSGRSHRGPTCKRGAPMAKIEQSIEVDVPVREAYD